MDLKEVIKLHQDKEKELAEQLKIYVVDQSISLDDRWELFCNSNLGKKSNWIERFEELDADDSYSPDGPIYLEKYETITVRDLLEQAKDKKLFDSDAAQHRFQEDVLKKFIYSFKFDW